MKVVFFLLLFIFLQNEISEAFVQFNYGTLATQISITGGKAWQNIQRAGVSSSNSLGCLNASFTNILVVSGFDFSIPEASQILGIQLVINSYCESNTSAICCDRQIEIKSRNVSENKAYECNEFTKWTPNSFNPRYYGGSSDLWNLTFTSGADFQNISVIISGISSSLNETENWYISWVQMNVYYNPILTTGKPIIDNSTTNSTVTTEQIVNETTAKTYISTGSSLLTTNEITTLYGNNSFDSLGNKVSTPNYGLIIFLLVLSLGICGFVVFAVVFLIRRRRKKLLENKRGTKLDDQSLDCPFAFSGTRGSDHATDIPSPQPLPVKIEEESCELKTLTEEEEEEKEELEVNGEGKNLVKKEKDKKSEDSNSSFLRHHFFQNNRGKNDSTETIKAKKFRVFKDGANFSSSSDEEEKFQEGNEDKLDSEQKIVIHVSKREKEKAEKEKEKAEREKRGLIELRRKIREEKMRREKEEEEEREKEERKRLENEKLEQERKEKERLERERLIREKERLERERREKLKLEKEKERLERERSEKERLERERLETERLEKERKEKEEWERILKEEQKKEEEEKEELERLKKKKEELERKIEEQKLKSQQQRERKEQKLREERERKQKEELLKNKQAPKGNEESNITWDDILEIINDEKKS